MKNLAAVCLCLYLLTGCASDGFVKLQDTKSNTAENFTFVDDRPAEEKKWKPVKNDPSNPFSQILYINHGDENFSPNRVTVLRSALSSRLSSLLAGKKIVLKSFHVREYPIESLALARASAMAAVSVAIATGMEPIGKADFIDVELQLTVNDTAYKSSDLEGYHLGIVWSSSYQSKTFQDAAIKAINSAVDKMIIQISEQTH